MTTGEAPEAAPKSPASTDAGDPFARPETPRWLRRLGQVVLGTFGFGIAIALGATYGVAAYAFFTRFFPMPAGVSGSGVMLVSFLAGVPLVVGWLTGVLARRRKQAGLGSTSLLSLLSLGLMLFAVGALFREGSICILMALPLVLALGLLGVLIDALLSRFGGERTSSKLLSVAWLLPFAFGAAEQGIDSPSARQQVHRSLHIAAPPGQVWQLINFPLGIQPAELQGGWAYRIGVPYPVEARTLEMRLGGRRELVWQRGVRFEERITAWEPGRHIAWTYHFAPDSFPPGSLDDHIVIGGRYFGLEDTAYTLTPEAGGTRLDVSVTTRVTTHFNPYAALWARWLIGDTAEAILGFYKRRAEAAPGA